ncbi:MAG: hypothetical protein IT435_16315 [Phycisphaerales bacterium]|nr:hypothetical protein [Phycisphaerales bacterium]
MNTSSASLRVGMLLGLLACALGLPGCIVWDIRDQLQNANNQLVCVQEGLDQANKGLASANDLLNKTNERLDSVEEGLTRLDKTNLLIDNVERGLGRIDNTNTSLTTLEQQLAMLNSIEKSLIRVDQHLAGLRKSMAAIDGVIPFLDLGGDYVEPAGEMPIASELAKEQADTEAGEPATGQPSGTVASAEGQPAAGSASGSPPRRDSLMGAWISAYPDRSIAIVVHNDGTYERSAPAPASATPASQPAATAPAKPVIERGTWKREGVVITFTPEDTAVAGAGQPAASGGGSAANSEAKPGEPSAKPAWTVKVVSVSSRALAVEDDAKLVLFSRP